MKINIDIIIIVILGLFAIYLMTGDRTVFQKEVEKNSTLNIINLVEESNFMKIENINDIVDACKNLSLRNTARCMIESIKPYYIYTITPDNVTLTFEELLEKGGDCRDWSLLYADVGYALDFNTLTTTFVTSPGIAAHKFTVMNDASGYCILDGLNYNCWEFSR